MSQDPNIITACIIIIGNEILSGRTKDKNIGYLAGRLTDLGIRLKEARVVSDDQDAIVRAVNETRARYDYVFTSGGIGPTHDDITSDAIAAAFQVGIDHNPEAVAIMEAHYEPGMLNEARLRMARIPFGAVLVDNPVSRAPGYRIENVYVFAGVPVIMQAMFEGIRNELTGGAKLISRTVGCYLPEGTVAGPLAALQQDYPDIEMGSYPFYRVGRYGTSVVLRGTDGGQLEAARQKLWQVLTDLGGEPVDADLSAG